jgi:ribosomal protein L29
MADIIDEHARQMTRERVLEQITRLERELADLRQSQGAALNIIRRYRELAEQAPLAKPKPTEKA